MFLTIWCRRVAYRWQARKRRRAWRRLSPEAQAALLVDYIGRNRQLRAALRQALRMKGGANG